jgi:hypothetical protein
MAVRMVEVMIMLFQVRTKALYQQVFLCPLINGADIINWNRNLCHTTFQLQRKGTFTLGLAHGRVQGFYGTFYRFLTCFDSLLLLLYFRRGAVHEEVRIHITGSNTLNVTPSPVLFSAQIKPPWFSAIFFAMCQSAPTIFLKNIVF